jgi:hypothetical protein
MGIAMWRAQSEHRGALSKQRSRRAEFSEVRGRVENFGDFFKYSM